MLDLLGKEEVLLPELQEYLFRDEVLGPCIKHPLVFSIMHHEALNAFANAQYKQKSEGVAKAWLESGWDKYVALHERPYRFEALLECIARAGKKTQALAELIHWVWIDSENIWQHQGDWRDLLREWKPLLRRVMDEEEKAVVKGLPDIVTIYRGSAENPDGLSWTLSKEKAQWFANRFNKGGTVIERQTHKNKIIFYTNGRSEQEIVLV